MRIFLILLACLGGPGTAAASEIDYLTVKSLYLETIRGGKTIGQATGFLTERGGQVFLVTNWHVVTGIDPNSMTPALPSPSPDAVRIYFQATTLGKQSPQIEQLFEGGVPRWIEHPSGGEVDVVALPLRSIANPTVRAYPLDYKSVNQTPMLARPGMSVMIVGFPRGWTGALALAIWKTGHIASEPDLDWRQQRRFLIDATTRKGMSGSPVYLRSFGTYQTKGGGTGMTNGAVDNFLGIYSAQAFDPELGVVWKPAVIDEILNRVPEFSPRIP